MVEKRYLDAEKLLETMGHLGAMVLVSGFKPDFIVAIWRGGADWNRVAGVSENVRGDVRSHRDSDFLLPGYRSTVSRSRVWAQLSRRRVTDMLPSDCR